MKASVGMRVWTWGMLLLCSLMAHAQTTRLVQVLDSLDRRPIPEVVVKVDGRLLGVTGDDGQALIPWEQTATIRFEHLGYEAFALRADLAPVQGTWVVRLVPRERVLDPVAVGRAKPEEVFRREDLHAADLLVNAEGLWVLAYQRPRHLRAEGDAGKEILRDVRLVLLDTLFNEVASCPVPEDVFGLRHDLRNDVVIEGTTRAFGVGRRGKELVLLPFGLEELRRSVLPWTDSIPGWVVGSSAEPTFPALEHLALDPVRDSMVLVCTVVDTFMMDLFRSEYKYLKNDEKVDAMYLAAELGVDKEIVAAYMRKFSKNVWFKPLYAPLFVVGDTLLVFDHPRKRIRKFSRDFKESGTAPIVYQAKGEERLWAGQLSQDRATGQVYAHFRKNGSVWLRAVDPVSGLLGPRRQLQHEYPERVQAQGGWTYYIWRPYGSLQKRSIYRERL